MSTTLDLINAIQAGDSTGIEQHFDYLMTSRIAERLDDMRVEVAKNMFKEEVEELDEEFEDITPEEIEEFMQTEDFEQLDEISKDHLRSYLDKSMNSYSDENAKLRVTQKSGEDGSKIKKKIMNRLQGQMKAYDKIKKA